MKDQIKKYIEDTLEKPREEFGGLPACPFVKKERVSGTLLVDTFDNSSDDLLSKIKDFDASDYTSAVFGQVLEEPLSTEDSRAYQNYINRLLKNKDMGHLKVICANPADTMEVMGFNPRATAPCFLITVTNAKELVKAHRNILKSNYFINFGKDYLKYLMIKEEQLNENWHKKNKDSL